MRSRATRSKATEALAYRIHAYAESSAITALLTADFGAIRAVAKGAKRIKNGLRGPLDTGVLYRVRIGRRGSQGLFHLHSGSVREAFACIRREPVRFHAACLVLEVAADLMREEEPHRELFRLAVFTLKAIDRAPVDRVELALTLFLARAVSLSGHVPETDACLACGGDFKGRGRLLLSPSLGGVVHLECGHGAAGVRPLSGRSLALLTDLWARSAGEILAEPPRAGLSRLRSTLMAWLEYVLERRFRAAGPADRHLRA